MGKKFTVLILRNMIYLKQTRFNKLLDSIEGINAKILSLRLKEMERDGLIERKIFHESPVKIEYHITEKGKDLKPILEHMSAFSMKYFAKEIFKDKNRGHLVTFMGMIQDLKNCEITNRLLTIASLLYPTNRTRYATAISCNHSPCL